MMNSFAPRHFGTIARAIRMRLSSFSRDEDGALIIFALMLLTMMIWMGGFALDLMRFEATRTQLQNTLDRSTLAAASLNQRLDPVDVVNDYFAKAGMSSQLSGVTVTQDQNYRNVSAEGLADSDPWFMHLLGIDSLYAGGGAAAEQRINNVEISLVLDVSGSMAGAKIANLKIAAAEFVNTMLVADPDHRVSIAIVPYNAQVNLGPRLRAQYNATNLHGVSDVNCIELPTSTFGSTAMSTTLPMPMMAYADIAYGTNQTNGYVSPNDTNYARPNFSNAFCKPTTVNIVRSPGQDIATLQSQINGLQAGGNTSIMLGMKWGTALLDPAARPVFSNLITENQMPATLAGRPANYGDSNTMKVIVLMTDGEHVAHNRINDAFKTGPSPIYRSNGDGQYSIFQATAPGANKYWVPHLGVYQATAWNSGAGVQMQNWEQVWSNLKMSYVAWQFYGRALGTNSAGRTAAYNAAINAMQSNYASVNTMNDELQQTCTQAKDEGVIVYGIAFEAPANGQQQISNCSSSNAHYFNANGLGIQTAFRSIASNISQLKLTQ